MFFVIYFHNNKSLFLYIKESLRCSFDSLSKKKKLFSTFVTINIVVNGSTTSLNCFLNSDLYWKQFFRSSSNLNRTPSIIIRQIACHFSELPMHFFHQLKNLITKKRDDQIFWTSPNDR